MQIEISITPDDLRSELSADIDEVTERFFESLKSELAPAAREVIDSSIPSGKWYGSHRASAKGQPFANKSFETYESFLARMQGKNIVIFEMSGTMRRLDSFLGGHLQRDILEDTIDISVTNTLAKSL
jgi:hypothetical protein